jgi:Zn-finger nucleic acid-binding protein
MQAPGAVSCPRCGKPTAAAARRCAHCGAVVEPNVEAAAVRVTPVACPACTRATQFLSFGGVQLDGCLACGGVWFDDGELGSLADELGEQELALDALQAARALGGGGRDDDGDLRAPSYYPCPLCREVMSRRNYKDVSGVILHRCDGHGAWLDHPNVLRFLKIVSSGGLRELDQRALELRTQQERRKLAEIEEKEQEVAQRDELREEQADSNEIRGVVDVVRLVLGFLLRW